MPKWVPLLLFVRTFKLLENNGTKCCIGRQTSWLENPGYWTQVLDKVVNTLRPRQNGRHFANDILKRIFFNENVWISVKIALKFVPKGPINMIPAMFRIMAWHCLGDKPLSEAMLVSLPMHICITRPQWVKVPNAHDIYINSSVALVILCLNSLRSRDAFMCQ